MTSTETATASVTDGLRSAILSGRFEPGDRLLEVSLAHEYDCGRAAIRAALVALRISIGEAIQITQARAALESLIAAHGARNATVEDHVELQQIITAMGEAVGADRSGDYSALNGRLHQRLREMSGHHVAAELVANLRNRAAHHQFRLALMPGRPEESLGQHAAIVDAVVAGNEAAAAASMVDHLESIIDVLRRWGDAGP